MERENIKPGDDVEIMVSGKPRDWFNKTFGMMKGHKKISKFSTEELSREIDKELYLDE